MASLLLQMAGLELSKALDLEAKMVSGRGEGGARHDALSLSFPNDAS